MSTRKKRRREAAARQDTGTSLTRPRLPEGFRQGLAALAVLSAVAFAVYGRALHCSFIFDDFLSVLKNRSITRLWPLVGASGDSGPLVAPWGSSTAGRPLVNLSLAINYHFGQVDPFGYHVFNLVMHVLSATLLCAIVRRTSRLPYFGGRFDRMAGLLALLVAIVWLVHPLQTEAVEYITQRTELMMGFFYLSTLYASLRYFGATSSRGRMVWPTVAGVACLLGMACKEVMVSAPLVVLLFERTFVTGSFQRALRQSWPLYMLLALGWSALLILNHGGPRSASAGFDLEIPAYVWWFTQAKVLAMYLQLVVWPWPLVIHYDVPYLGTLATAWPWLVFVGLSGIGTLVLLARRTAAGFVCGCVFLILSPTIVVPIITEVAAERRMYLPLAAILALVIIGGYALLQKTLRAFAPASYDPALDRGPVTVTIAATVVWAIVLSVASAHRLEAYGDPVTLWEDTVRHSPNDAIAYINLGGALNAAGRYGEAVECMAQLLRLDPDSAEAHYGLAVALVNLNRSQDAIEHLEKALHGPDAIETHYALGIALINVGRSPEAVEHLALVAKGKPNSGDVQNNLARALQGAGRAQEAIEHFLLALNLGTDSALLRNNLASALTSTGRLSEAITEFEQAVRLRPDYLEARTKLTMLYAETGRSSDAIAMAERALALARSAGLTAQVQQIERWLTEYRQRN
ncbi:MAG TPA: tetratricopeptide repeat protein [Pirellulales bacterium]|jgi:tetratricopeptide (TPR) repeat protein